MRDIGWIVIVCIFQGMIIIGWELICSYNRLFGKGKYSSICE